MCQEKGRFMRITTTNRVVAYLIAITLVALFLAIFNSAMANAAVIELTSPAQVKRELSKPGKMVLMYGAPWCPACKNFHPIFEKASKEMKYIRFYYVNVDKLGLHGHEKDVTYIPMVFA